MPEDLFDRLLVPVASATDARATSQALNRYIDGDQEIHLVHVVEQTPGGMDRAPPDAREEDAEAFLADAAERLTAAESITTEVVFGTDPADEIVELAEARQPTAILFYPREKGRLTRLVTGEAERKIIHGSPVPVIALPARENEA